MTVKSKDVYNILKALKLALDINNKYRNFHINVDEIKQLYCKTVERYSKELDPFKIKETGDNPMECIPSNPLGVKPTKYY